MLLLVLCAFLVPCAVRAQAAGSISIAEAVVDTRDDGVPDRIGEAVSVAGLVLSDPFVERISGSAIAYIEDDTRGVTLVARDPTLLFRRVARGDSVVVRGVVARFEGERELVVETVERTAGGAPPTPRDALAGELHGERLAGRLVRVVGELSVFEDETGWLTGEVRDRSGKITVPIDSRFVSEPDLVDRVRRGGSVDLVGIVGQRQLGGSSEPRYVLLPRDAADWSFPYVPPYRQLAMLAALLVLAGGSLHLFLRRRRAERRAAEMEALMSALRESESRYRHLVERITDIVVVVGSDYRFRYVNPAFEHVLGHPAEAVVGRSALEFVHPDEAMFLEERMASRLRGDPDPEHATEIRYRHRSGGWCILQARGRYSPDASGEPTIVITARDVTMSRQAEDALRASEDRLRQVQKMEAVGQLAGGVAHDFNNLLTAVKGNAQLLLDDLPGDTAARAEVEEIAAAADRARELTQQLLAFGRKSVLQPRVIELNEVVDGLNAMLRRLLPEDIELSVSAAPEAGTVEADRGQLEQVIINLAVNARDAMPRGGRLTIETAAVEHDTVAAAPELPAGRYAMLTVRDSGDGIPPALRERIFEPFFTTKEMGKGTGLGLATVYGIVKQSGGDVAVESDPGRGATFRVYLPAAGPLPVAAEPAKSDGQVPGTEKILVVEDEAPVRTLVRRVLERSGYTVLEAENGHDALRVLEEASSPIDLVLTDVVMPVMDGRRLVERLRAERPELPVIYMSGHTEDEVVRRGVARGEHFIAKPFGPDDLVRRVRTVLDGTELSTVDR